MIKGAIIIEGHVQGLANTRALGEAGIPVVVIDQNDCIASKSKYCSAFFKCPDFRSSEFIEFLLDLALNENLSEWSLIPSNDHIVYNLSQNIDKIKCVYKTIVPEPFQLANIYNKQKLLECAERVNVPIPKTYYPQTINISDFCIDFPVILKGKFGLSFYKTFRKKVFIAKNQNHLQQLLTTISIKFDLSKVFIQEIIPFTENNKTISFTAFCINGSVKTYWIGQKLREHPWKFGTATFTESIHNNTVREYAEQLLQSLKYTGVCEVEFLYHSIAKEYQLIEINPRTWLWVGLAKANGINYALYLYNFLNGIESEYPKNYQAGLRWRNFWTDTVYSWQAILKGKLKLKDYTNSLTKTTIDAVRSKDDPKPFRAMTKMLFALAARR
jgi:predicted ATP-grasp superfamily ATP-dependent carboligase